MDTIDLDETKPALTLPAVILDASQYFLYQTHQLEVLAPDGRHLDFIGKSLRNDKTENRLFRLRDQAALVSCLLSNINDSLTLPVPAVLGITDLLESLTEGCR